MNRMIYTSLSKGLLVCLFISSSLLAHAQSDTKAKSLLDQLSAKTKSYQSIKADFNYILENKAEDFKETQSGVIIVKGDKYKLKIAGQEITSDGKNIWTYLKDAEEVQITEVDNSNDDQIKPGSIFTMYENGFRHAYKGEVSIGGVSHAEVDIYPLDLDEKSYHTIKLYVNQSKMQLKKIEIMGKEGDTYTYEIKSFQSNVNLTDADFSFQKSKHPDVEVIDLR